MSNAPILLFTYKRLATLKQTVAALQNNPMAKESDLFIFSDGAKYESDEIIVAQIRDYLNEISGFKTLKIIKAEKNKGLANSIIDGVTQVMELYEHVIVLEDDLITTPNFLDFMNSCLNKYRASEEVFSISGYSFNLGKEPGNENDNYFLTRGWSWGWATWKDRWDTVDWQVSNYESFLNDKRAQKAFANGGSDLNKMLESQMLGKLDSWAIRWFYNQFLIKGLTAYPVLSKVYNAGFDNDATHTNGSSKRYEPLLDREHQHYFQLSSALAPTIFYQKKFQKKMGMVSRVVSKVDTIMKNLTLILHK